MEYNCHGDATGEADVHFESREDAVAAMAKEGSRLRKYRAGSDNPRPPIAGSFGTARQLLPGPVPKSGLVPDYTACLSQIVPQSAVPSNYS